MIPSETEICHFIELYSTRHFTRAALRIGVTQPTLTQSILRLEEKLGTSLFQRTKQGCIPTKSASIFYGKAIRLSELWKEIGSDIGRSEKSLSGIFRIGCHVSVASYTLPNFIKTLASRYPDIEIKLHHDRSRKIAEKIIYSELDLGFVVNPVRHPDLILTKLGDDSVALWKATENSPKRLFADADWDQQRLNIRRHRKTHFKDWQLIETPSLELIKSLVVGGAGWGILPERIARADGAKLKKVNLPQSLVEDEIYLVRRVDAVKSSAGKAIVETARTCLQN